MCRNIRTLHDFEPPATEEEIRAAAPGDGRGLPEEGAVAATQSE
jgi:hypothetical protein